MKLLSIENIKIYLECLAKFVAHDVINNCIDASGNIIQNTGDISCKHEDFMDNRVLDVIHSPHVNESLPVKRSPT